MDSAKVINLDNLCKYNVNEDGMFETNCKEIIYWEECYSVLDLINQKFKFCPYCGKEIYG